MKDMFKILAMILAIPACNHLAPFPDDEDKTVSEQLAPWQEGCIDIHQISTGRGDCALLILPDGTTLVVDAGDLGSGTHVQEIMMRVPSQARTPGEWQVRYMKHFLGEAGLDPNHIDYLLATHFHSDHIGTPSAYSIPSANGKYQMSGISYVCNYMDVDTLLDRDWPDYAHPVADIYKGDCWTNYREFVRDRESRGGGMARFEPGRKDQIVLKNKPSAYPDFEIRNIYCNGWLWTGNGTDTEYLIPEDETIGNLTNENLLSAVLKLSYGKFDYHTGGDILGASAGTWRDIESKVCPRVGEVDAMNCDHHSYRDAMNSTIIKSSMAQVYVIPVWDYYHPEPAPLARMLDESLYDGERMVFAAGLVGSNRARLGEDGEKIKPDGHVVIRVYPGGDKFQVFVLNDRTSDFEVIYKTDIINSR